MGSINSQINAQVFSAIATALQYFALLVQSPYFLIAAATLVGLYLLHLTRGLVAAKTLPFSTVGKSSPVAWTVPAIVVSLVIVKVISALR